jgi:hypothetical protein
MKLKLLAVGVLVMAISLFAPLRLLAHHGGASLDDMSKLSRRTRRRYWRIAAGTARAWCRETSSRSPSTLRRGAGAWGASSSWSKPMARKCSGVEGGRGV